MLLLHTIISFIIVISVIVFIHEFGHYAVAKLAGVKVDAFSIGFGKELFGFNDRSGTRWKVSLLPLGGYVKMYGDVTAASTVDEHAIEHWSEEEKQKTFHYKPLYKKAAIVVAGPLSNFLLTIGVFTYFIMTVGLPSLEPIVGEVMPNTPAALAGLQAGDRITQINNDKVTQFGDISYLVSTNLGTPVHVKIERGDAQREVILTPMSYQDDDGLGNKATRPLIGIRSQKMKYEQVGLVKAVQESVRRTYMICTTTLKALGQMITGKRSTKDLKGPIGIAQLSGQASEKDPQTVLWLIALLSANLGLVNLLPIPLLDGGHLAYYAAEALRGRPLAERVQQWGFRIGQALLVMLMVFTLFNDLSRLFS